MKHFFQIIFYMTISVLIVLILLGFAIAIFEENPAIDELSDQEVHNLLVSLDVQEDDILTAEALRKHCKSKEVAYDGFCTGYMLGFVEAYSVPDQIGACDLDSLRSSTQAEQAFENFMEDHPEHWKKDRSIILGAALRESFPCPSL